MKIMKRTYIIMAAVCLAFGLTACASKTSETEAAKTSSEQLPETEKEEGTEETREEAKTTAEAETEKEKKIVTGRVEAIEKTVVTISGQDGQEYQVELKDAKTKSDLEIGEGDEIQVVFMDDGEEVKVAGSYTIISSVALEGDMDPVLAGAITEVGADTITIETDGGSSYTFSTAIAQVVTGAGGLEVGGYVEITYLGRADEGTALRVITEEGSGKAEATYNILTGTLVSYTDATVTIQAADGSQFTFALDDYVVMEELELGAGDDVEITYD